MNRAGLFVGFGLMLAGQAAQAVPLGQVGDDGVAWWRVAAALIFCLLLAVGGALHYKPEEFVGRMVVVCTNLEPKKIGNIISRGMLLAADGPYARLVRSQALATSPVTETT